MRDRRLRAAPPTTSTRGTGAPVASE